MLYVSVTYINLVLPKSARGLRNMLIVSAMGASEKKYQQTEKFCKFVILL